MKTEHLNDLSVRYVQSLANGMNARGEPGLIVTAGDVRVIKRYVTSALELPVELAQVRRYLGYDVAEVAGLEPQEMQALYDGIKRHAEDWFVIESGMKTVGTDLVVFSDRFKSSGETLIAFIEGLEGFKTAVGVVGEIGPEGLQNPPDIGLTDRDRRRSPALEALLENMRSDIEDCSRNTARVNTDISTFKNLLKSRIVPALGLKLALARRNGKSALLDRLHAELDELNQDIREQTRLFENTLEQYWSLAAFVESLFIPNAVPPSQSRLEALIARKRDIQTEIRHLDTLSASLISLETNIQQLAVRVHAAASGASNLESLWMLVQAYIDGSAKRLANMNDAVFLVVFVARLRSMIRSWSEVKGHSQSLLTAFNNAIEEVQA